METMTCQSEMVSQCVFLLASSIFFLPTCGYMPRQPLCNTSTVSKVIKRCSNSKTLKGFIGAVLSTRHLPGRLAVAGVTLTNGN